MTSENSAYLRLKVNGRGRASVFLTQAALLRTSRQKCARRPAKYRTRVRVSKAKLEKYCETKKFAVSVQVSLNSKLVKHCRQSITGSPRFGRFW